MKFCKKCNIEKEIDAFHKHPDMKDGHVNICKLCDNKRIRNKYLEIKDTERYKKSKKNTHLKRTYGITFNEYTTLLEKQNGVCGICCDKERVKHTRSGEIRELAVDHCHITGQIRGLLCSNCNLMIGNSLDNIFTLQKAIEYLLKNTKIIKIS